MRLHRFYTTEELAPGKIVTINSAELVNQVRRVFRLKSGDEIILFNGTHFDYRGKIANYSNHDKIDADHSMVVQIDTATPSRSRFMPARKIFLYAAVVKKDTFEWIVEKATELGVTDIIPVIAERSEKKNLNEERLNKIAIEASEQSGRGDVPVIHSIISLKDSIEKTKADESEISGRPAGRIGGDSKRRSKESKVIAFHTEGEMFHKDPVGGNDKSVAVFIGPEGGWSDAEVELFHKNGIAVQTLGTQVLRSETAVIATLSQVVFG